MADENRQDSLAVETPVDQAALREQSALQEEQDEDLALAMQGLDEDSLSDEYNPDELLVSDQPSGDAPTTDVAPAEEQGLVDTVKDAAEEQVEQKVDVIEDTMTYKGNYQNVLARVLDNIGVQFGDDSVIGGFLHRLAANIEQADGDNWKNVEPELLNETNAAKLEALQAEEGTSSEQSSEQPSAGDGASVSAEGEAQSGDASAAPVTGEQDGSEVQSEQNTPSDVEFGSTVTLEDDATKSEDVVITSEDVATKSDETVVKSEEPVASSDVAAPETSSDLFKNGEVVEETSIDSAPLSATVETNLAEGVARDVVLDEKTEAQRDIMEDEILARAGITVDKVEAAQDAIAATDSASYVDELARQAAAVEDGSHAAGTIHDLDKAVAQNATSDPVATGQALETFNETSMQHIENVYAPGTPEYEAAVKNLETVQTTMSQTYYETVLATEQTGKTLTTEEVQAIDNLNLGDGVQVPYSQFTPDTDISIRADADAADIAQQEHEQYVQEGIERASTGLQSLDGVEVLRSSDGKVLQDVSAEERESNEYMARTARNDVSQGHMLKNADASIDIDHDTLGLQDFSMLRMHMQGQLRDLRSPNMQLRTQMGEEANPMIANNYMTSMHGLQAYNDAAADAIRTQYANDPEALQKATDGLANSMRVMITEMWDAYKNDDEALNFFSEEDIAELDAMQFTGVNVKYSDYMPGMNLKNGEMLESPSTYQDLDLETALQQDGMADSADMRVYANMDVPSGGSWAVDKEAVNKDTFIQEPVFEEERAAMETGQQVLQRNEIPSIFKRAGLWQSIAGKDRGAMAESLFSNVLAAENGGKGRDDLGLSI